MDKKTRQELSAQLYSSPGYALITEKIEELKNNALKSQPRETLSERISAYEAFLDFENEIKNEINN